MAAPRYFVAFALGGIVVAFGLTRADSPAARPESVPTDTFGYQLPKGLKFVGNLSCASAACHAAADAGGRPGSEYKTWANGDPHFGAFKTLSKPRSQRMIKLLYGPGTAKLAQEDARCLSCHAPKTAAVDRSATHGVGCESCHGPAEKWLTTHYQDEFKALSPRDKAERFGLYPTKDLAFRVTMCASCHVGDAGREVDHDLIAAGHPRLAFEYTGYHHSPKYKRHWQETSYGPDFDARAWEIGQVASARSAAKLLAARAVKADHAWPELAEYTCFACHKGIDREAWKGVTTTVGKPGSMSWAKWYFSTLNLVDASTKSEPGAGARATTARSDTPSPSLPLRAPTHPSMASGNHADWMELTCLMEAPLANRTPIAEAANKLGMLLDIKLRELQLSADANSRTQPYSGQNLSNRIGATIKHAMTPDGRLFDDQDWDSVTQHYLGVAAYYYSLGNVDPTGRDANWRPPLELLRRSLPFPKGYNSPKGVEPVGLLDQFRLLYPNPHRDEPR